MVSEKLIAFILKARQNKRNDDQIAQQLLSVGWKQEAITDAFSEIKSKKITSPTPAQAAKMAQSQAAQKMAAPSQPQPSAPPWVKPDALPATPAQPTAAAQPSAPAAQPAPPTAQSTAPQQQAAPVSSAHQQTSSSPPEATQSAIAPAQQAPAPAQTMPVIPTPQPAPATAIPPASQIQLPQQKKSLFSSLFGKKPAQPALLQQPAQPPQQPAAPVQQPAAKPPVFPPRTPAQTTLQPPVASQPTTAQGQSTLATFAGATAQQSAASSVAQQPLPSAGTAPAAPKTFSAPQPPPATQAKPAAGLMKFLPIIGLVVLLAIAAGAFYVFVIAPANSVPPIPSQPLAPPAHGTLPSNPVQQASGPIDCGNDMGCFSQASGTCTPAKMTRNSSTNLIGMTVSGSTYMEIKNTSEAGKCSLYSLVVDSSVAFSNSAVASALAKGVSMEDIQKQEAASALQAKATIGMSGACKFNTADLSAMLSRWNAGSFASTDYAGADCSGSMLIGSQTGGITSVNLSSLPVKNAAANGSTNATAKPGSAANNSSTVKMNATSPPKANATAMANTSTNKTSGAPANASAANATNASSQPFAYSHKYTTYYPEHLVWFCTDRKTEFYRMHYQEYFGGGCNVPRPKDGFVGFDDYIATGCTMIPCCINGPYNEYSRSYDYFECGYN